MKYKVEDPTSYQVYWEPLKKQLGEASTIYLSPDGVYNQINLESIQIPEKNGKYVLDSENIILVNNTKDLFSRKLKKQKIQESKIAALFGNPQFYLATAPGIKIDESGGERSTDDVIAQLPGTELEISEINELLGADGWLTYNHMFGEATEASIKALDNPRIFHIATHGFFKVESGTEGSEDMIAREIVHDPLMRSGLLLKGAGDILNTTDYNFNINDGILTAYEAMNLNLDQTELVVLSACETGLGAVEAGEGVFGLQRAFLVAGAKAVVMSLFKVSDDATQKLMVNFYKYWLESGDARKSFIAAKKDIRSEYKDPIYWAPFVMIGLN
jgi:CHAT domain-containing protein